MDIFFADCRASIDILPRHTDSMVNIIGKTVYIRISVDIVGIGNMTSLTIRVVPLRFIAWWKVLLVVVQFRYILTDDDCVTVVALLIIKIPQRMITLLLDEANGNRPSCIFLQTVVLCGQQLRSVIQNCLACVS